MFYCKMLPKLGWVSFEDEASVLPFCHIPETIFINFFIKIGQAEGINQRATQAVVASWP